MLPDTALPLSALQERMWFLCTAYEGTASPIVALTFRIAGPLDAARLVRAVHHVSLRHDALRVTLRAGDSGVRQVVGLDGLHTEMEEGDEETARRRVGELTGALLDLERGPLARSVLIRLSDQDHVWCVAVHHILADGQSMALLVREVLAVYAGESLAPLAVSYAELMSERCGDDVTWWVSRLQDLPVLRLPEDLPRPAVKAARSVHVDRQIDLATTVALEQYAREKRCTLFMVLLSAYQQMLCELSGQQDVCVGVPASGRITEEQEGAFGLFNTTLPIRTSFETGQSFPEGLARTREAVIGALAHQGVTMGQIVAGLDLKPDPSRTQVFQTTFSLHSEAVAQPWPAGLTAEPFQQGSPPQALHDLVVDIWRTDAGLSLTLRYDAGLFTPDTVVAWACRYEEFLAWLTSRSSTSVH